MSKRYIPQTPNNDFVYPNNDKVEYDIEIYHEINDNVPIGIVSGLTLSYNTEVYHLMIWSLNSIGLMTEMVQYLLSEKTEINPFYLFIC